MTIFGIEISWEAITACATIIAAIGTTVAAVAAACAARQSKKSSSIAKEQLQEDIRWKKLDRTFSYSPYLSEKFLDARDVISEKFPNWEEKTDLYDLDKIQEARKNADFKKAFRIILNHWGRFASEYSAGILDKDKANELHRLNFNRFCRTFENYLKYDNNKNTYKNTLNLFNEWKTKW